MYKGKSFCCIVPARGGSNRLFKKNIRRMYGRPMISYVANAIKETGIFDRIICSTDAPKIAKIASDYGLDVPFIRPANLARHDSTIIDTIQHALTQIEKCDYVLCSQPTSPLVKSAQILGAADMLIEKDCDMVIGVCAADEIAANYSFPLSTTSLRNTMTREKIHEPYCPNGAIYLAKWEVFFNKKNFYETNVHAYKMDKISSIDVDDKFDFEIAEYFVRKRYGRKVSHKVAILRFILSLLFWLRPREAVEATKFPKFCRCRTD